MRRTALSLLPLLALALGGVSCSVVMSVENIDEARGLIAGADEARASGNYDPALKSYLRARSLLEAAREAGLGRFGVAEDLKRIAEAMKRIDEEAAREGYVRIADGYFRGEELDHEMARQLSRVLLGSDDPNLPRERLVPDSLEVNTKRTWDGREDVTLSVVLKETGGEKDFSRDAWAVVRFLLEGGFGHGFSFHISNAFPRRPWMGRRASWGVSEEKEDTNCGFDLKDAIERITVNIYRGSHRPGEPPRSGPFGYERLEAVGPYWGKSFYRSYSMDSSGARRLNWEKAALIPDSTLYGLLTIREKEPEDLPAAVGRK